MHRFIASGGGGICISGMHARSGIRAEGLMGLRELVLADLKRAQRLIALIEDELDPQFRIASPEGDWWIGITHSADAQERKRQLGMVSRFMAWKLAPAFTQAVELEESAAVACVGCSHVETIGYVSLIERKPLRFSESIALAVDQIGDEIAALLPRGGVSLRQAEIDELKRYFADDGIFPAVHIASGRIGVE
ncbi:MAG: hypothetical protein B7Z29_14580 [Hyphomicrobium sp. 12-62-95]|jgi:hypothetical protein|nr:MAG: hypothetical protein B7Z29_14580 [Hyphomicrobium sp. 12-62-95]